MSKHLSVIKQRAKASRKRLRARFQLIKQTEYEMLESVEQTKDILLQVTNKAVIDIQEVEDRQIIAFLKGTIQ